MTPIDGPTLPLLQPHTSLEPTAALDSEKVDPSVFGEVLEQTLAAANGQILGAEAAAEAFAAGTRDDIHGTMLALSKADIQLRMVGTMRNKIVDAFYELWRLQV